MKYNEYTVCLMSVKFFERIKKLRQFEKFMGKNLQLVFLIISLWYLFKKVQSSVILAILLILAICLPEM